MADKKTYAPKPVTGVQLKAVSASKLRASWVNHKSTARPYDQIIVQMKTDSGKKAKWKTCGKAVSGSTSKLDISVKAGHKYRVRVIAKNSKGKAKAVYSGTVNIPRPNAPKPVSGLVAKKDEKTGRIELRWKNNESLNREYSEVYVYVRTDGGEEFEEVSSSKAASYVYDAVPGHTYKFRVEAHNDKGFSSPVYSGDIKIAPLKPLAPSDAEADRVSDGSHIVSWRRDVTAGRGATAMVVQRSTDGGAWSLVAEVGAVDSWTDNGTAANHSYRWRVCARNSAGDSPFALTGTAVTTPAAPGTPSGDRLGDGTATIRFSNTARNVTAVEVQRYDADYGEWADPVSLAGLQASYHDAAAPVDAVLQYRARNVHGEGTGALRSAWTALSPRIVQKGRPKAPLLLSPEARAVVRDDGMSVEVSWRHNPVDGSAQTAAQVRVAWGSASRTVAVSGPAASCRLDLAALGVPLNTQVSWSVRTRGAYRATAAPDNDNMSPWSETRAMTVCRAPSVAFVLPGASGYFGDPSELDGILSGGGEGGTEDVEEGDFDQDEDFVPADPDGDGEDEPGEGLPYALVADFPLALLLDYTDESGALAQCTLSVADATGAGVYSCDLGADGAGQIAGELNRRQWAPENNARYTLTATVRSTTSLTAQASIDILTDFDLPKRASLEIEADRERGWLSLTPRVADYQDGADVDGIDIWRVTGSEQVLIASDLADGEVFTDRFAPLNTEFAYRTAVYSRAGTYRTVDHPGSLKTPYAFVYYGEGLERVARGMHSPTESAALSRTRRRYEEYAGRPWPVLYDGGGRSEERTIGFNVKTAEEAAALAEAMDWGRCVCKTLTGSVFWCTVDIDLDADLRYPTRWGTASAKVKRIDGGAL